MTVTFKLSCLTLFGGMTLLGMFGGMTLLGGVFGGMTLLGVCLVKGEVTGLNRKNVLVALCAAFLVKNSFLNQILNI